MKTLFSLFFLMLSGAVMAADAVASDIAESQSGNWLLAKYDINGDTRITKSEVTSKRLNIFRHMDGNADGGVSFSEYEAMDSAKRHALLKSRFNKLDPDQDGQVTEEEYSNYLGLFASIDSNGDGTLTMSEMSVAERTEAYVTSCMLWFCLRTKMDD